MNNVMFFSTSMAGLELFRSMSHSILAVALNLWPSGELRSAPLSFGHNTVFKQVSWGIRCPCADPGKTLEKVFVPVGTLVSEVS